MKFRVGVQVQPGKSGHAGIKSVLSSAMSRPMDANPVTRLRKKELMALASPGKTPSSERQRPCRQRPGEDFKIRLRAQTKLFFLRCLTSEARVPNTRVRLCAQCTVSARKKNERDTHGIAPRFNGGKGPFSPPNNCLPLPLPLPRGPRKIGHGTGWPRSRPDSVTTIQISAHIDGEWSLLAWPWGFPFPHSLEDLHAQLVRVTGTISTLLTVDPRGVTLRI